MVFGEENHGTRKKPIAPELVPKLIDYALKRMVLEQALTVFRPRPTKP
jgi:hypothetical protein